VLASFVSGPTPPQGNNYAGVSNPDFDEIVAESSSLTGAEACGSWEQAESAMYAAADYVPFAMRPDITYGQGLDAMITPNGTMFTGLILVED
jgi:peptide/nickel transport system substrate-binding protein